MLINTTNSSNRLTLLSFTMFKHHNPVHDHSCRQHQWDDGSFSIISLTECQEALSEGQCVKQTRDTYFVWSWRSHTKRWYWALHIFRTLLIFSGTFPQTMKLNGKPFSHLKLSFDYPWISPAATASNQLWRRTQLLTQGCVYRPASQMGGTWASHSGLCL